VLTPPPPPPLPQDLQTAYEMDTVENAVTFRGPLYRWLHPLLRSSTSVPPAPPASLLFIEGPSIVILSPDMTRQLPTSTACHSRVSPPTGCPYPRVVLTAPFVCMPDRFSSIVMFAIVTNTVVLSMDHYPMDAAFGAGVELVNFCMSVLFAAEMTCRLLCFGVLG
jgi:hypothetical protein